MGAERRRVAPRWAVGQDDGHGLGSFDAVWSWSFGGGGSCRLHGSGTPKGFREEGPCQVSRGTQNPDSGRWGVFLAAKARTEEGAWQSKPGLSERIEISN